MEIPFEQDVAIEKFVRRFKERFRVRGSIEITISDSGYGVESAEFDIVSERKNSYEKGAEVGENDAIRRLRDGTAIDLYHELVINGDDTCVRDLLEYYKEIKDSEDYE